MSARDLIVAYLEQVHEERTAARIINYLWTMHHVTPTSTRTALGRLVRDDQITRISTGRYERNHTADRGHPASD